jgi:hypothetical protein
VIFPSRSRGQRLFSKESVHVESNRTRHDGGWIGDHIEPRAQWYTAIDPYHRVVDAAHHSWRNHV